MIYCCQCNEESDTECWMCDCDLCYDCAGYEALCADCFASQENPATPNPKESETRP